MTIYSNDTAMKTLKLLSLLVLCFSLTATSGSLKMSAAGDLTGGWKLESVGGAPHSFSGALLIEDGYIFYTEYDIASKHFEGSLGGQYSYNDGAFDYTIEFDTWNIERIGMTINARVKVDGDQLSVEQIIDGEKVVMKYSRLDNGSGDLDGAWRITDRMRNGSMQAMRQGVRKTIKMISGNRFEWAAFNPETKQFSGTGGGTIELKDGKYTENIEFFSRNKDRVGAKLTFDYKVDGIKWDHSGLSSSGNPIREIWTRQNQ